MKVINATTASQLVLQEVGILNEGNDVTDEFWSTMRTYQPEFEIDQAIMKTCNRFMAGETPGVRLLARSYFINNLIIHMPHLEKIFKKRRMKISKAEKSAIIESVKEQASGR